MIKKILLFVLFPFLFFAQSGFIETPDQLYYSIDNKKPRGDEVFKETYKKPPVVDLSGLMPSPGFQGGAGNCAAWASGYACKTFQEVIERGYNPQKQEHQFSPSFLYNLVNKGENKGSTFPDVFNAMINTGCATLKTMPYTEDYLLQPGKEAFREAGNYKIKTYKRIQEGSGRLNAIRSSLAAGQPVLVAMKVYDDFYTLRAGIYSEVKGKLSGGHGMCIVGYDDQNRTFKLINSWGTDWGDQGYCKIAYDVIDRLIMEAYLIYDIVETKQTNVPKAPDNPRASEGNAGGYVDISWEKVSDAASYLLYRSDNQKESLKLLKEVDSNYYRDEKVLDNVKYIYAVKAKNASGTSSFSEIACGWASKEELGIPGNVTSTLIDNIPELSWDAVSNAEGYYIYRWTDKQKDYTRLATSKDESFRDVSIPAQNHSDMTYYYLVTAFKNDEESKAGNRVQAFVKAGQAQKADSKKIPEGSQYTILPSQKQKSYTQGWDTRDFYDDAYITKFFEQARKAEEEAFRKMKREEEDYFKHLREAEEAYKKGQEY